MRATERGQVSGCRQKREIAGARTFQRGHSGDGRLAVADERTAGEVSDRTGGQTRRRLHDRLVLGLLQPLYNNVCEVQRLIDGSNPRHAGRVKDNAEISFGADTFDDRLDTLL